jgi:hypothetical protein
VDPSTLPALPGLLSTDRFATYLDASHRDPARALRLYCWNAEVSAALWGPFHVLEVTLRNALHGSLAHWAGRPDWWRSGQVPLRGDHPQRLRDAITTARRNHGSAATTGHVVAELGFGFWIGLLANRCHQSLWVPALHDAFPRLDGRRTQLHAGLERLCKLRNRTAHHEPVFARDLTIDHELVLDILGYIAPDARTWVTTHSRVLNVVAARKDTIDGRRPTTF